MSPLRYKVYTRAKGMNRKAMIAGFADLIDAVNYAADKAGGFFLLDDVTLLVTDGGRKVCAYRKGERV